VKQLTILFNVTFVLMSFLVHPLRVEAQECATILHRSFTTVALGMRVSKSLAAPLTCIRTDHSSAACPTYFIRNVMVTATVSAVSPTCMFRCAAGPCSVTIDGSDGLPVELMEFGIDE